MFLDSINKFLQKKQYPSFIPKAVFFDMDGVLFDSMNFHATSWVKAMSDVNIPFTHYEAYMNEGRTGSSTIDGAFNKVHGRNATEDEKHQIYRSKSKYFESYDASPVMPYALDLLEKIKAQHLEIFVVTGSGQASLLNNLDNNFPNIFVKEKMVTAFDVKYGKPNPEPYLMALKKSQLKPWEVLVVENAPLGIESSTGAGLFTIGVNTGILDKKVLSDSGADIVFDSMHDLFKTWDKFCLNWH